MPKRVDHEERRRQIADALLRTAAKHGLHATGMREVAAEAGVSLRLVQYYFGTKEELMLFAMQQLATQFGTRAMAQINKIKQAQDPVSPRDVIAAIVTQALPADDERRTFTMLNAAYFALSLTEPTLAIDPLVKNSNAVIDVVASQLRAAQAAGDTPTHLDPDLEALSLLAMSAGLGTSVLCGQSSPGQAQAVIDYHLGRLFPAARPALPHYRLPTPRPSRRSRTGFGPLLLGYYDPGHILAFAGKVGTGFTGHTLDRLHARLAELEQDRPPFDLGRLPRSGVHWVQPRLVAQVGFSEWTTEGGTAPPPVPGPAGRQGPRRRDPGSATRHPVSTPPFTPADTTAGSFGQQSLKRRNPLLNRRHRSRVVRAVGHDGSR